MAQTIHDLFREIDKAIEQVRAMGACEEHLSLKLPRAALPDFRQMCNVNDPAVMAPSKYRDIPITEWTDGPFMSFSLDHNVMLAPADSYVTAEECKAYVAIRIKASDCCPGKASGRHYSDCPVGGIGEPGFDTLTGMRIDMPPSHEMGKAKGGPVPAGMFNGVVGERGPEPIIVKPKRSPVAAMMAARRARKTKPFPSEEDQGVHRAISAMQKPGRAHEL